MRLLSHSPLSSSRTVDPSRLALGRSISCARSEWEAMVVGDRHTTVFFWLQLSLKRLADKGALTQEAFSQCCAPAITSMRAQANDLMSSLDRDTPFPYIALAGVLVQVNLLLMSTWKGLEWSQWFATGGQKIFTLPKFWADLGALFLWNLSYQGMYDLSYYLWNPFLDRRIDVAHEAIGAGLRRLGVGLTSPRMPNTIVAPAQTASAEAADSSPDPAAARRREERGARLDKRLDAERGGAGNARCSRRLARRLERGLDRDVKRRRAANGSAEPDMRGTAPSVAPSSAPRSAPSKDGPQDSACCGQVNGRARPRSGATATTRAVVLDDLEV